MSETGQSAAEEHRTKRVLIVDDDVAFAQATSYALQSQGYDVSVAYDGSEALLMIDRVEPDLMILDMMMPKRSGFVVIETLQRNRAKPLKVIMCAASEGNRQKAYAETLGVDEYFRKPVSMAQLLSSVKRLLN